MDNDDIITKTALEDMFTQAEKFQADVVYCEKYFESVGTELLSNAKIMGNNETTHAKLFDFDLAVRVQAWIQRRIFVMPWLKLVRREILIDNEIVFPEIIQEDSIWSFEIFMLAKRFVMIPNACYIHRARTDSVGSYSWKMQASIENIRRKLDRTIRALKDFDNFLGKINFFKNHEEFRYAAVNNFMMIDLDWVLGDCLELPPHEIYETIKNEFKNYLGEHDVLIAHLCTVSIMLLKTLFVAQQNINPTLQSMPSKNSKKKHKKK